MSKFSHSLVALLLVVSLQIASTLLFFHPYLIKWGATEKVVNTSLLGDDYAEEIRSTRAITINSSGNNVWECLVNIGADRKGFYSYYPLEYLFGCKINEQKPSSENTIELGRLVPIKSMDKSGKYTTGFKVVAIKDKQALVLHNWGTFFIETRNDNTVQLIIRTHGKKSNNFIQKLRNKIFDVLHYVMEKRMLLGIKDEIETNGKNYTTTTDSIWMLTIAVSMIIGLVMIFVSKHIYKIIVPTLISIIIQYFSFVLKPNPYLGILLLCITLGIAFLYFKIPYLKKT
ncbi:MAG: hypothetical protein V3U92_00870 [Cellulophaga sp.]